MKNKIEENKKESNSFIEANSNIIFWFIICLTAIFSVLLFNIRIDEGGDDSSYICRAIDLLTDGRYPSYQGPLYPMILSIVIAIFGIKVTILKFTSFLFIIASQIVFYKVLKNRIGTKLLLSIIALLSFNSWYLFFASQTYSEAFFILLEYVLMGLIMRYDVAQSKSLTKTFVSALPSCVATILCMLVRTVGLGFTIVNVVYLCFRKQYKKAIVYVVGVVTVLGVWLGVRTMIWGDIQNTEQLSTLTQVDPYDPSAGKESISGYIKRFAENSNLYVSKRFMQIVGFKSADNRNKSTVVTIIIYLLFGYGCYVAYRKNKYLFYMAINSTLMLGMTFIILQPIWDQPRLIMPYMPMALAIILFGIHNIFICILSNKVARYLSGTLLVIISLSSFAQTREKIDINTLRHNLSGEVFYGYTPDWVNYLSMCKYAAEQLPEESYVACRKPNMARICGNGKKFYGIYTIPSEDPDELIENLRSRNVTHIIVGSLRRDPAVKDGYVINTIHRYVNFVLKKYPNAFIIRQKFGTDENEPATLLEINYNYIDNVKNEQLNIQNEGIL